MQQPGILDIPQLLTPISEDQPVGCNLREDVSFNSLYYQIKDARSAARVVEREQMQGNSSKKADSDWNTVFQLAIKILSSSSKDLEITAWLIEALLRKHGFAGLKEGFNLLYELVKEYWDSLYPEPDEEGLESRVASLTMLNGVEVDGTLIVPILGIPITEGKDDGPYASWEYQQALEVEKITDPERKQNRLAEGAVSLKQIESAAHQTSPEFFKSCVDDIQNCMKWMGQLNELLEQKCGPDAPPMSKIREALNTCHDYVKYVGRHVLVVEEKLSTDEMSVNDSEENSVVENVVSGQFKTREQAFQAVLKIADFFRRTEPQSLLPYLLEKSVRWGGMSMPDLMNELIEDETTRKTIFRLADVADSE